jgi:hypothetical protein
MLLICNLFRFTVIYAPSYEYSAKKKKTVVYGSTEHRTLLHDRKRLLLMLPFSFSWQMCSGRRITEICW